MSSECTWRVFVMSCFTLVASALGGTVCTVNSRPGKDILFGSNFTIFCKFNKDCTKEMFRNKTPITFKQLPNSSEVSVFVTNLTTKSIFTCKCKEDPEPCGIDISPGYPPGVPQNLTCIRKTSFGNASCSWTTGRNTMIPTTCQLRVEGDPHLAYESLMNSTGICWATFPIKSSITSKQLTVFLNVSNSLSSKASGPHTFILSNIEKPSVPNINYVNCSSRWCHLHTDNHSMSLVELQYGAVNEIGKTIQTNAKKSLSISSLQPHTKYKFKIRRKINQTVGLWSDWSQSMEAKTKEEAPDKMLDIWYIQEPKSLQSENNCFHIFWKELNISDAKGKIQMYNISILEQKRKNSTAVDPRSRNQHMCCTNCSVSVSAVNSKGQSPGRFIPLQSLDLDAGFLSHTRLNNHTVALFWQKFANAGHGAEYVVHWFPVGDINSMQWIRVERTEVHISGLQPQECYQCGVTALGSSGPVTASIKDVFTWQSAPDQGPVPQVVRKETESVKVKWSEIPQEKRRGCLKKYTVYLMNKLIMHSYSHDSETVVDSNKEDVGYPERQYIIRGLPPGQCYNLSVSAWTDAGEGPRGTELSFCTLSDAVKLLSVVILTVILVCLFLLCLCQYSSVQRRVLDCCQCLRPTVIPDPANSKCAKTYTDDQGETEFYLYPCDSSASEEPDNVEVVEVPYHHSYNCTYIKSFSQESGSSEVTQSTRTMDITVDYMSTQGAISGGEEDDDEEEGVDDFDFFPSAHSPFLEPLVSAEGKPRLDTVKILQ